MMKLAALFYLISVSILAGNMTCFEVSDVNSDSWVLRVSEQTRARYVFRRADQEFGLYSLVQRARCFDCNKDLFQMTSRNSHTIQFDGNQETPGDIYSEAGNIKFQGLGEDSGEQILPYRRINCE